MNNQTLNQVINKLREIQQSHAQLNTFGFREDYDISTQTETYPLMWCSVLSSSVDTKTLNLNLGIAILDLVSDDNSNNQDVLSDTLNTCLDVIAMLDDPNNDDNFELSSTFQLDPIFEGLPDKVNGWMLQLSILIQFTYNRCQVPIK